jgi:hypothetical protein
MNTVFGQSQPTSHQEAGENEAAKWTTMTSTVARESIQNEELAEEIDAINAIYDPSTVTITSDTSSSALGQTTAASNDLPCSTTIILRIPSHPHSSFLLAFDVVYPSTPPRVLGTASTSSRSEGNRWVDILSQSVAKVWRPGFVCLYDVIVEAMERFDELRIAAAIDVGESTDSLDRGATSSPGASAMGLKSPAQVPDGACSLEKLPDWILSDAVTEKKSVFLARVTKVESKEDVERYLEHLLATEKKVASATHNISAWRIRKRGSGSNDGTTGADTVIQDFDDDGEAAAGGRLLHLMQLMDVWDVMVVVSRWYGGLKLGPDRFRIINAVARDALLKGAFAKAGGDRGLDKGKKKAKSEKTKKST